MLQSVTPPANHPTDCQTKIHIIYAYIKDKSAKDRRIRAFWSAESPVPNVHLVWFGHVLDMCNIPMEKMNDLVEMKNVISPPSC